MRRVLGVLLVVLLAVSGTAAFAEGEDIVLTYGKEFDFDGKTFLEGQDLENNYYLDTCGSASAIGRVDIVDTSQALSAEDTAYIRSTVTPASSVC